MEAAFEIQIGHERVIETNKNSSNKLCIDILLKRGTNQLIIYSDQSKQSQEIAQRFCSQIQIENVIQENVQSKRR